MTNVDWNNKDNNWSIDDDKEEPKKEFPKYLIYIGVGLLILLIIFIFLMIIKANRKEYSINIDQLELRIGSNYYVKEKGNYEFKLENNEIAKVNKKGTIRCLKEGSTYLTVSSSEKDNVILMLCVPKNKVGVSIKETETKEKTIEIQNIEISNKEVSITKGDKVKLTVVVDPVNATNQELKWTSDNPNVVVDSEGVVFGNNIGNAVITVTAPNGKSSTCNITVIEQKVEISSISLNVTQKEMSIGESFQLTTSVSPANASLSNVSWSSSDSNIVSVQGGKITALKSGTATITARTSNGKTATCRVDVKNIVPTSVSLNKTSINLGVNETFQLIPTINPSNVSNKTVTWVSSNNSVATVDSNGNVKGIKSGTATIIANTSNGKVASCEVKVGSGETEEKISYLLEKYTCKVGEKINTKIEIKGAKSPSAIAKYGSQNTSVATIKEGYYGGLTTNCSDCRAVHIECKSVGTTKLTATSSTGLTTTSTVIVTK